MKFPKYYKNLSVLFFGKITGRFMKDFQGLKPHLISANIRILLKAWVCIIFMSSFLAYVLSLMAVFVLGILLMLDIVFFVYLLVFVPLLVASFVFLLFYLYPIQKANNIRNSIETNLPFALAHINAIASSGIPPEFVFELLTDFKEYGAISDQAGQIVRNIKTFGMSSVNAINDVAKKTPSDAFREVLTGMSSTIEKGGNLVGYLNEMAEKALFDYKIKREKYLKTLSTYADIYTALLVAAPLMMLAVLGVMNMIGGAVMGLGISELIFLITWAVLPALNIGFLMFIHITYPNI